MEVHHHPIAIGSHTARKKWTHYFRGFRMAGIVSYSKNSRPALTKTEDNMKASAIELIVLLKEEYRLN